MYDDDAKGTTSINYAVLGSSFGGRQREREREKKEA